MKCTNNGKIHKKISNKRVRTRQAMHTAISHRTPCRMSYAVFSRTLNENDVMIKPVYNSQGSKIRDALSKSESRVRRRSLDASQAASKATSSGDIPITEVCHIAFKQLVVSISCGILLFFWQTFKKVFKLYEMKKYSK